MTTTRTPNATTPGRRRNAHKENIYFEPGKFGRKTGITLRDTGVRDEHGFEPVSGIFSSPNKPSPERISPERQQTERAGTDAPQLGKTPRFPARSPGPRRTNISGSPVRQSFHKAGSPTRVPLRESPARSPNRSPSRVLIYQTDQVRQTVEKSPSPEKTRTGLETKSGKPRKSLFEFDLSPERKKQKKDAAPVSSVIGDDIDDVSRVLEHDEADEGVSERIAPTAPVAPMMANAHEASLNEPDDYMPPPMDDDIPELDESLNQHTPSFRENADQPNTKKKRGRPRKSGESSISAAGGDVSVVQEEEEEEEEEVVRRKGTRARKSGNSSILDTSGDVTVEQEQEIPKKRRGRPPKNGDSIIVDNSGDVSLTQGQKSGTRLKRKSGDTDDTVHAEERTPSGKRKKTVAAESSFVESEIGANDLSMNGAQPEEPLEEDVAEEAEPKRRGRPPKKPKVSKPVAHRQVTALRRNEPSSQSTDASSQDTLTRGSIRLRSNTPFEDEGCKVTRSGRASIKPLAYWKNESQIYRHGELEGVVRAHEIVAPKRVINRPYQRKRSMLGRIAEEEDEEPEDLLPEAWEKEIRVIRGPVRRWDEEVQAGHPTEEDEEGMCLVLFLAFDIKLTCADIAFSAQSIKPRDVPGSGFRYAKVMTMDYFGAGLVEIPPDGFKRSKNVRKMQMCFFVHQGKVTVDVAGMTFGITAGGMFQVPRGECVSCFFHLLVSPFCYLDGRTETHVEPVRVFGPQRVTRSHLLATRYTRP